MTIETKYNIGDTVWFMKNNKLTQGKITVITVESVIGNSILISHGLNNGDTTRPPYSENELFPTKQDLINSLI